MDSSPSDEQSRNWLELPRDVTLMILMKLGVMEILECAQFVCKSWHNACKDPSMWRTVQMENTNEPEFHQKYDRMTRFAVDRSSGGLVSLAVEGFGSDELLSYIADRSNQLKCLRLACCYFITASALIEALKKFPSLEEVELSLCSFSVEGIKAIIPHCSTLKTFKLNEQGSRNPNFASDEEALAISQSMPELRHLQLVGNSLTDDGLQAILDGCPCLESLDLRACFHVYFSGNLRKRCDEQIKSLRRPYDSTDDYKFVTVDYTDYDSDFDEVYVNEVDELDFVSDDEYYEFSDDGGLSDYEEM